MQRPRLPGVAGSHRVGWPRVPQIESDEIVAAVKRNGALVEYLVLDDEGHGFRKQNH
jgi:hypothetical protein